MNGFLKAVWHTGLGALMSGSFAIPAFASGEVKDQPIQIHCNVSTRVVAGDLYVGLDPLSGYVTYDLEKYHATVPQQNYKKQGSNGVFLPKKLLVSDDDFSTTIKVSLNIAGTRVPVSNADVLIVLEKNVSNGDLKLKLLKIDGVDHTFQGSQAYCTNVN